MNACASGAGCPARGKWLRVVTKSTARRSTTPFRTVDSRHGSEDGHQLFHRDRHDADRGPPLAAPLGTAATRIGSPLVTALRTRLRRMRMSAHDPWPTGRIRKPRGSAGARPRLEEPTTRGKLIRAALHRTNDPDLLGHLEGRFKNRLWPPTLPGRRQQEEKRSIASTAKKGGARIAPLIFTPCPVPSRLSGGMLRRDSLFLVSTGRPGRLREA